MGIHGLKRWKEIAKFLPGRIGKQCRERWINNADPIIKKDKWTREEDLKLMAMHQEYGNKWAHIHQHIPGRTDNDIKNRYNASLKQYKTAEEYLKKFQHQKKREVKVVSKSKKE